MMSLTDYISRIKDRYTEKKARTVKVDLDKRDTLGKLLTGTGIVFGASSLVALTSRLADAYDEITLSDEYTFKADITKYEKVWVQYTYDGVKGTVFEKRANKFWSVLKEEFGNQVDAYIVINCTGWSNNLKRAVDEIQRKALPSFILYKNGEIVKKDEYFARIRGPPPSEERTLYSLKRLRKYTFLE